MSLFRYHLFEEGERPASKYNCVIEVSAMLAYVCNYKFLVAYAFIFVFQFFVGLVYRQH